MSYTDNLEPETPDDDANSVHHSRWFRGPHLDQNHALEMRHEGPLWSDYRGGPPSRERPGMAAVGVPTGSAAARDRLTEKQPYLAAASAPAGSAAAQQRFSYIDRYGSKNPGM